MKLNKIAFAVLAMASTGAFAATKAAPLCTTNPTGTTAAAVVTLVSQCAPEVTFFAAGGTAMRDAYKVAMSTMFDTTKPVAYIKTLKSDGSENKDQFAMYGFGKADADASIATKRLAIIVNTANGSMAGVNMNLSGAKVGSLVNKGNGAEFAKTIQLQTATNQAAGVAYFPAGADLGGTSTYTMPSAATAIPTPIVVTLKDATGVADLKTGWGADKTKTVGIAFTDVRPIEAVPGQLNGGKWDKVAFPYTPIAMQGFEVIVNNNLKAALVARDVAEGRCASAEACTQPTIFSADMTSLMMGKRPAGWDAATPVTLQRRVDSSGTQAATQIFFASVPNPALDKTVLAFAPVLGANLADKGSVAGVDSGVTIVANGSSDSVVDNVGNATAADAGYVLGVVSSDKGSNPKSAALNTSYSVKIDGFSPNYSGGSLDANAKLSLAKGYPFQFEFGVVTNSKNTGAQKIVADAFIAAMKNEAISYKGVVFKGTGTGQSPFSRNGNNFNPLSQY